MSREEIEMCWRLVVAVFPACIEQIPPPSEVQQIYPDLSVDEVCRIHQDAVAGLALEYASAAIRLIRQKSEEES